MKTKTIHLGTFLIMLLSCIACSNDDDSSNDDNTNAPSETTSTSKYLLALSLPTIDSYPFHIIDDITQGTATIDNAQEIPNLPFNVPITGKDGFIYLNSEEKLTKYGIGDNGILVDLGAIANLGISGGPVFEFLSDDQLLITSGPRGASDGVLSYQIINTTTMTEISNGTITLPVDENSIAYLSSYILKEGKIYVPYIHADDTTFGAYDRAPIAIFDATTMAYEKTIYTENAAALGYSIVSSHGFSENGDLYITACNTNYWGANETIPSGIVRINAGASDFDTSYFFNLSEKFNGNHTGGMLYIGNNKAIVQVFRSDLIAAYSDYQGSFVIEYHVVDLVTKQTQQLNIPLCKYPRRAMEVLANGTVAIVGNTETEGNNIYIYNPTTNTITKGLSYTGTEFIETFMTFE